MDATTKTTITTLEHLVEVTIDGIYGYRRARESIGDPDLHETLAAAARDREAIWDALRGVLLALGKEPPHHGTFTGAMSRGWLATLSAAHAEKGILHQCLRGERATIDAFSHALALDILPAARNVIQTQLGRVVASLERLENVMQEPAVSVRRPSMPPAGVGAIGGAVTGAIAGGIAGPIGSIAGGVIGAIAGGAAAQTIGEVNAAADLKDKELDREIGVTEGHVGLGTVKRPPPQQGAPSK